VLAIRRRRGIASHSPTTTLSADAFNREHNSVALVLELQIHFTSARFGD
jgi:hypothetical protein